MLKMSKLKWKFWLGIALSLLFLYLACRKVELNQLIASLKLINYWYLLPALVFVYFSFLFRALRWRYFLLPIKEIGINSLFSLTMIGFMANNLLPFRMGEIAKVYLVGKKESISKSASLATVVLERLFDLLVLFLFLVTALIASPLPQWVKPGAYLSAGLFLGLILFLVVLKLQSDNCFKVMRRLFFFLPKRVLEWMLGLLSSFVQGLAILDKPGHILIVTFHSLLVWLSTWLIFYIFMLSYGLNNLPLNLPLFLVVITAFGVAVPSSPGYVGNFHFFCMTGLTVFGVDKGIALSYAILLHAFSFIVVTLGGLIYLWKENISLSGLEKAGLEE